MERKEMIDDCDGSKIINSVCLAVKKEALRCIFCQYNSKNQLSKEEQAKAS